MHELYQALFEIGTRAIGLFFAYSVVAKMMDLKGLANGLRSYGWLPSVLIVPAAGLLLIGEIAVAVAHMGLLALTVAVPLTVLLLVVFLIVVSIMLARGIRASCLCFGTRNKEPVNGRVAARIVALLAVESALWVLMTSDRVETMPFSLQGAVEATVAAASVLAIAAWVWTIPEFRKWFRLRRKIKAALAAP